MATPILRQRSRRSLRFRPHGFPPDNYSTHTSQATISTPSACRVDRYPITDYVPDMEKQLTITEIPVDLSDLPYLSYSSFTMFVECGEKYRLKKIVGVDYSDAAWYFTGGSAVHAGSEAIDFMLLKDKEEAQG